MTKEGDKSNDGALACSNNVPSRLPITDDSIALRDDEHQLPLVRRDDGMGTVNDNRYKSARRVGLLFLSSGIVLFFLLFTVGVGGYKGRLHEKIPETSESRSEELTNDSTTRSAKFSHTPSRRTSTVPANLTVGAYYYPWHGADFHKGSPFLRDELIPKQAPVLGKYDDTDTVVITQHLKWSRQANIGLWVTSWWGPGGREDVTTITKILPHKYLGSHKIALFYETNGRILFPDFSLQRVETDIAHMCENYFGHTNYYTIDNRPVLFMYVTRKYSQIGVLKDALLLMRSIAAEYGFNPYIIGDQVFQSAPTEDYAPFTQLDAVTNYDVRGGMNLPGNYVTQFEVDKFYIKQSEWKTAANKQGCAFVPPAVPGYNDRSIRLAANLPAVSRRLTADDEEGSLFRATLRGARVLVDSMSNNLMMINSFNEWHEDSQIEPTSGGNKTTSPFNLTQGIAYESYGELYLNILSEETRPDSMSNPTYMSPSPLTGTTSKPTGAPSLITTTESRSNLTIGAYYYPWYGPNFHNGSPFFRDELIPKQSPALGKYDDTNPVVIAQHLKWSRDANIGLWVTSWWGPGSREDVTTMTKILPHDDLGSHKIALFYETNGRIREPEFSLERVGKDILHLCENYFGHANYYTINDRPVLFMYVTRKYSQVGVLKEALLIMRSIAAEYGFNPYIIGDQVFQVAPTEDYVPFTQLDAVTNYDVRGGMNLPDGTNYVTQAGVNNFFLEQSKWKTAANRQGCAYVPPVVAGFNDRAIRLAIGKAAVSRRLTPNAGPGSLFRATLRGALELVDHMTGNLMMINSFNEWHEDSQIEPTVGGNKTTAPFNLTQGVEYEAYGEMYFDILREETLSKDFVNETTTV